MRTFRHLMTVGMGAAIALGTVEPSTSQEILPPAQHQDPSAPRSEVQPEAAKKPTPAARLTNRSAKPAIAQTAEPENSQDLPPLAPNPETPGSTPPAQTPPTPADDAPVPSTPPPAVPEGTTDSMPPEQPQTPPPAAQPSTDQSEPSYPEALEANPNPLQFPTEADEVRIVGTQPISLEEALELSRRNNRPLQAARLELERSRAVVEEAKAAEKPNVNLQAGLTNQESASPNRGFDASGGAQTSLSSGVELSYDVYTSGRRSATIRASERQLRRQELEVERIEEQLRFDVTDAYYDLQEADEQVRIAESAVRNAERTLDDARLLERAGVRTRFDVLQAQVQLANEQQNLTQARSRQRISRRTLAQILSLPQQVNIAAQDPVQIAGLWEISLEESIVQAYKNRAELEQRLVDREVNDAQREAALAAVRPQVSVFARYNVLDIFDDGAGIDDGYALGAQLNWNLYDGGASRARARQQEIGKEIAELDFADQRNQVRLQVEQSYFDLQSNFENIQTASVALEQARESLRLARLRFQAGVGTQTEVIDAETELTRAEGNRVQAILGYNRALASLQRSISNLPPEISQVGLGAETPGSSLR